jgi:hypothetical protein
VFWVDVTGQHGLIAARADQSSGIRWYNGTYFATNATADGIYAGAKNTEVIVAAQASVGFQCAANPAPTNCPSLSGTAVSDYAALVASNYSIQDDGSTACSSSNPPVGEVCYGDWYLPSKVELNLLNKEKNVVGGFDSYAPYWSSTEGSSSNAWNQYFQINMRVQNNDDKRFNNLHVRAVRAF